MVHGGHINLLTRYDCVNMVCKYGFKDYDTMYKRSQSSVSDKPANPVLSDLEDLIPTNTKNQCEH